MLLIDVLKVSPGGLRELLDTAHHEIGPTAAVRRITVVVIAGAYSAATWVDLTAGEGERRK